MDNSPNGNCEDTPDLIEEMRMEKILYSEFEKNSIDHFLNAPSTKDMVFNHWQDDDDKVETIIWQVTIMTMITENVVLRLG